MERGVWRALAFLRKGGGMGASEKKRRTLKRTPRTARSFLAAEAIVMSEGDEESTKRRSRSQLAAEALVMSEELAARRLGVSVRCVQRWRVNGKGPAFRKLGRLVGYTDADLVAFVDAHRQTSTSAPSAA
jgi:hypothetical protein